jgi:hypothetical protein
MPHAIRAALLVCLLLAPAPVAAASFTFSGVVSSVSDSQDLLDASVATNTPVSGTYDVDLSSSESSSPFDVGLARLVFQLGNYLFDASENPHQISLINDRVVSPSPLITVDVWQSRGIVLSDLSPATGVGGGGYAALIEFFDYSSSQFDGTESAPFVPPDPSGWDQVRLTLNSLDGTGAIDGRVQVQVDLDSWGATPVPEPHSAALLALGLAAFALRDRRKYPAVA